MIGVVLIGIITYQLILFLFDFTQNKGLCSTKTDSIIKGEIIAWIAVGARVIMIFFYPFGANNELKDYTQLVTIYKG